MAGIWSHENPHGTEVVVQGTDGNGLLISLQDGRNGYLNCSIDAPAARRFAVEIARRYAVTLAEIQGLDQADGASNETGKPEPPIRTAMLPPATAALVESLGRMLFADDGTPGMLTVRQLDQWLAAVRACLLLGYVEPEPATTPPLRPAPGGVGGTITYPPGVRS